jgi:phosphate acetyltransferase
MSSMKNITFEEIEIGATASFTTRTLSKEAIEFMALLSGDVNPFYIQEETPKVQMETDMAQAVGAAALVSAVLGTRLPGPGMKILNQDLRFHGTIIVGDELTATVTAKEKRTEGAVVVFDCRCVNQDGQELVSGTVTVAAPIKHINYR